MGYCWAGKICLDVSCKDVRHSYVHAYSYCIYILCQLYYHNSHGAIVVFDMTRPGTLHSASIWKRELSRHLVGDDAIPVLLVGNKVFMV